MSKKRDKDTEFIEKAETFRNELETKLQALSKDLKEAMKREAGPVFYADQSGSTEAFLVEARYTGFRTEYPTVGAQQWTRDWTRVEFNMDKPGVPVSYGLSPDLGSFGLLNYDAAKALQWWFLAEAKVASFAGNICFETRLVRVRVKYEFKTEEIGVGEIEVGDSRRRPEDWIPRYEFPVTP